MIDQFMERVRNDGELGRRLCYQTDLDGRGPRYGTPVNEIDARIAQALKQLKIDRLFAHQAEAVDSLDRGENVVVVTPTASGKTLTFTLPILNRIAREPDTCALLLYPLKALEQDQRGKLKAWQEALRPGLDLTVEIYDGDTPASQRVRIKRKPPNLLITNPDMLHQAVLAYHGGWEKFLRRLKYIVIDELHVYRGVFGSHILHVFRRLSRLLAFYGVRPQFICLSATIANPVELAESLTGHKFSVISQSGAPQTARTLAILSASGSTTSAASKLFLHAIDSGCKSIVFSKARVQTEIIHRMVIETRPDLVSRVSSYRAGFLSEERRAIEQRLSSGDLQGVISTSALELGIDIGGLDVCILAGYPGSMMSFWQRSGRVGRRDARSAVVLVAGSDALDQYLASRPEEFLGRSLESALVNTTNEEILRSHLPAAAAEIPLMSRDPFYDVGQHIEVLTALEREGLLVRSASGEQWFPGSHRPHSAVGLRNIGGAFEIVSSESNKPVGQISGGSVFRECHHGAIYLHNGEQYFVNDLDIEKRQVRVKQVSTPTYTMIRSDKQTEILDDREHKQLGSSVIHRGKVRVTETYHSYERRRLYTQELLTVEPLDLPPQSYITNSAWIELPAGLGEWLASSELHFMGGIHATEHAAISLIPLSALCDRNDIGGISFVKHKQLPNGAIFFYDGYPGGAGIADHVYMVMDDLLSRTLDLIQSCACEDGCPSCIQSPKCGSGNKPLDKTSAIQTLKHLLYGESKDALDHESKVPKTEPISSSTEIAGDWQPRTLPQDKRVVVFDLETQRSAEEVGGWNAARFMRIAVACVWDSQTGVTSSYDEAHVGDLISHLSSADLIVGYNLRRFDYEVLRGYTFEDVQKWPTLDLLEEVQRTLRIRLKLASLCKATLGSTKTADGLQSLEWFREGRLDLITEYCIKDVELTRDLLQFGLAQGYLLYERKDHGAVRIPLDPHFAQFSTPSVTEAA